MRWSRWFLSGRWVRPILVVAWTAFERFHMHWDLSWPWLDWATCSLGIRRGSSGTSTPATSGHALGVGARTSPSSTWCPAPQDDVPRWGDRESRSGGGSPIIGVPFLLSELRYATFTEQESLWKWWWCNLIWNPYNQKFADNPLVQLDVMLEQVARGFGFNGARGDA